MKSIQISIGQDNHLLIRRPAALESRVDLVARGPGEVAGMVRLLALAATR
jgi:hypothetical protein